MSEQKKYHTRIVLSFTTIPSRINDIWQLLNSISKQILKPDAVYLWVCPYYKRLKRYFSAKEIPSFFHDYNFVNIKWCEDFGPFTKIYKLMECERDPDTIIVTADDEFEYPQHWLKGLINMTDKLPHCALAYRGRRFRRSLLGKRVMEYYNSILFECIKKPQKVDIITASFGATYRRKWFDDNFVTDWIATTKKECAEMLYTDDVWISGYLARKKIKRIVIPAESSIIEKQGPDSLGPMNWGMQTGEPEKSNNQKSIKFFEKYW